MLVAVGETDELKLYKHKENDKYNYEDTPIIFYGKPASQMQKRNYRIQKGVVGKEDSQYIVATRLPIEIEPTDQIIYRGKKWFVGSIGYYEEQNNIVNRRIFNPDYIAKRSPKGITLE